MNPCSLTKKEMLTRLEKDYLKNFLAFSVSRISNYAEAEELAQEIAYRCVEAIESGKIRENFDAYLWSYGLWWWPFILITTPLCLFICFILEYMCRVTSSQLNILKFFGLFSLELYLFHERLLYLLSFVIGHLGLPFLNLIAIILTIIFAYSWKKIIDFLSHHQLITRKQKLSQP